MAVHIRQNRKEQSFCYQNIVLFLVQYRNNKKKIDITHRKCYYLKTLVTEMLQSVKKK